MITVRHSGNFNKIEKFLAEAKKKKFYSLLESYGRQGVDALSSATPIDSGETALSWSYQLEITGTGYQISWHNTNIVKGVPIAVILQYGHGTRGGGYVRGRDYINPAIRPIFDKLANDLWKEILAL